jgi:hypothetical protein
MNRFRLVSALAGLSLFLAAPCVMAQSQDAAVPAQGAAPFEITDNSFLVEEAFNQERGIVQNIFTWTRDQHGAWNGSFTQEWPAPGMTHQLSYTLPFAGGDGTSVHVGGVLLNYRLQVLTERPGRPAFSPRVSLILPTGEPDDASDRPGIQVNLPFSKQAGNFYVHWNAGFTWIKGETVGNDTANLMSPQVAASVIWRVKPMINLMLEGVAASNESIDAATGTMREADFTLSPGIRGGWNLGETQIVLGAAIPVTLGGGTSTVALLTYFSCELPFTKHR